MTTAMTLPEQTAIILHAAQCGFLQPPDVQRWALSVIECTPTPPLWIIDLAVPPITHMADIFPVLKEHACPLSLRTKLQVIIMRHATGAMSLPETLPKLFRAAILDNVNPVQPENEALDSALVEWDCQADLDVISEQLASRFHAIFQDYLADASDVSAVLRTALSNAA